MQIWRYILVLVIFGILSVLSIARILYLSTVESDFLQTQGDRMAISRDTIKVERGLIYDRNGEVLVNNEIAYGIWVNPKNHPPTEEGLTELAHILSIQLDSLLSRVEKSKDRSFLYLKRGVDGVVSPNPGNFGNL